MSGRSAYVRKEKTKVKDGGAVHEGSSDRGNTSLSDFPMPMHTRPYEVEHSYRHNSEISTIKSSGSDDLAYARVRKPHVPVIEVSGIEKSSFRSVMDKKSESFRKGLVKTFGKKKKNGDPDARPPTSTTFRPESHELDSGDYIPPPAVVKARQQQHNEPEFGRPGPPQTKLPAIPTGQPLKRWIGAGRPAQAWNKLRKDPELWDPNGDTLVFLGHETRQSSRPPPSFRLSSHVIEATESRFLIALLREGQTEEINSFGMPPSPVSSPGMRSVQPARQGHQHTPPVSEEGTSGYDMYDGQISYEITFPTPINQSQTEVLRYNVTTRNVFALLYQTSLVGLNLAQAYTDLVERLQRYMPEETDAVGMIIDYIVTKGFDDVRDNPSMAAALLAWSESFGVRWEEGWREAYVHCAGMYNRLEATPEYKYVTPITKALLERASLEVSVRVQSCEDRLSDFDFLDMWPQLQQSSPSRAAFQRLQKFLLQHYRGSYESWPPSAPHGHDQWLHRNLAQKLQGDFGALYDYFVNRDIAWDGSEERSGRKWNLVNPGDASFQADTTDLPFTDLLIAFDNLHKYPHIPHPYPLVPEVFPKRSDSKENLLKMKKSAKPQEDKMAERKAALAYTESTNIYLLGSDFVNNDLVDAFIKFEKGDRAGDADPYASRRGRWVLIYFILQTLSSVSVDTPSLRYIGEVSYHVNPRLRGTPPWKGANQNVEEASHVGSHCWTIRSTWHQHESPPVTMTRRVAPHQLSIRSAAPSVTSSDAEGSIRSPTMTSATASSVGTKSRRSNRKDNHEGQYNGYSHHVNKVDEWPIKEENFTRKPQKEFLIKDFDDYQF
jgi:hypothetical protein